MMKFENDNIKCELCVYAGVLLCRVCPSMCVSLSPSVYVCGCPGGWMDG